MTVYKIAFSITLCLNLFLLGYEVQSAQDKSTLLGNKFFKKDSIFKLSPSSEILQSDLKVLKQHFIDLFIQNKKTDGLKLNQAPNAILSTPDFKKIAGNRVPLNFEPMPENLTNLSTCRFIYSAIEHLCQKANIPQCNIILYMKYPSNHITTNFYCGLHAAPEINSIIIGAGFLESCFIANTLKTDKETRLKVFIFLLAHELFHLTAENLKKSQREREIHADKHGALLCKEIFSDFNPEIILLTEKIAYVGQVNILKNMEALFNNSYEHSSGCFLRIINKTLSTYYKLHYKFIEFLFVHNNKLISLLRSKYDNIFPAIHPSPGKRAAYIAEALKQEHL